MQNISLFKQRILQFIDNQGIKKSDFYRKTGITRGVLDHTTGLTEDNLTKFIATYPEINVNWLLNGEGEMLTKEPDQQETVSTIPDIHQPKIITVDSHNKDNIVLVPQKLKAGYLSGYDNPSFIQKLPTYRMPGINNGVFRMFEIEGHSMFPTLPNKSFVVGQFVENWETGIKDNQIYAIISNEVEDGLVKRCLNRIKKYDNLICKSDNRRNFPVQNINPSSIKEVWEVKLHLNFQLPDPADIYDRMNDLEAEIQQIKRKIK